MDDTLTFRLENIVRAKQEVMEDFEGPLDLILELLRREKIELRDLRVSLLTEQYLAWMERRRALDLEVASEFAVMASHLVYLKTKMLLSIGQPPDEEVDELIMALRERERQEEYQQILIAREFLQERMEYGRNIIAKPPEAVAATAAYSLVHDVSLLLSAVRDIGLKVLHRTPPPAQAFAGILTPERYPLREKIAEILRAVLKAGKILLENILSAGNRSEAIASFLAVLELCRERAIRVYDEDGRLCVSGGGENVGNA
jgi:segregation and condensation protein A